MFAPGTRPLFTLTLIGALSLTSSALGLAAAQEASVIEVHSGSVTFDSATNVSAVSVHGKSTALEGRAELRQTDQGLALERVEATVPVMSLSTGMGLRDSHMRKYVFTTADGQMPDIKLDAGQATCARKGSRDMSCDLSGTLAIRGTSRPFAMTLKISDANGTFRASGDADVKLSAYQIERPSQLGVQTDDDVKLHLEFAGKTRPVAVTTVSARGDR